MLNWSLQNVPHEPQWFSPRYIRDHGYEHRVCKTCGAGEDVHVDPAPQDSQKDANA